MLWWCRRLTFKTQVVPSDIDESLPEADKPGSRAAVAGHTEQWHGNDAKDMPLAGDDAGDDEKGKTRTHM